jgi:hypothetical protein
LKFKPWEWPPVWDPDIEGPCIWSDSGCGGAIWWPKGQKIRRELIAEIKTAAKKGKVAT